MGSLSQKGWIESIVAAIVAVAFSFLAIAFDGIEWYIAILPLVFFSLRRGLVQGLFAGVLAGILIFFLQSSNEDALTKWILLSAPVTFVGVGGFFAKFTQRTLHNKRFSNAVLNIVTASFFGAVLATLWKAIGLWMIESGNPVSPQLLLSFVVTFVGTAVVLVLLAKVAPQTFIPKDTPYLSRKEKSRLLND